MKLLMCMGFLVIGLSYGVAQPMENYCLNEDVGELTEMGLAIKGKSCKGFGFILNNNKRAAQEVCTQNGMSPLEYAFFLHGSDHDFMESVITMFIQAKGNVNSYKNLSALHYAAVYGYLKLFNELLNAGANIEDLTGDGASVVHCVVGKYREIQQSVVPDKILERRSSQGSPIDSKGRRIAPEIKGDEDEVPRLNLIRLAISKDPIISRLEMLKIFFVEKGLDCNPDQHGKLPQKYAQCNELIQFLDGITGTGQDRILYEDIKSGLTAVLISPRTPGRNLSPCGGRERMIISQNK